MTAPDYQTVNIRLPRDLHEAMSDKAKTEDRTMAAQIRHALRWYLAAVGGTR